MNRLLAGLLVAALAGRAGAQNKALTPGHYSATVKGLTCASCAPDFEKALRSVPGIAGAMVDASRRQVLFVVRKGAAVEPAALQKRLSEVAAKMGMGADYSLQGIQRLGAG